MKNNIIENKKIAIIGGGPGGLTLARLLQMQGAQVKVYERDFNKDVRVQGATLDLHEESGLEALRQAGLIDSFYANYRPGAGKLRLIDKHAVIKMDSHSEENFDEDRPEIDRGPLRNILLESLKPGTVVWDSQFLSMIPDGNGWMLVFKNQTTADADIVIAADGASSKIRSYITPIKPFYAGITIVEGAVHNSEVASPKIHELLKSGKIFAFGDDKSLIISSKGDGSLAFYTGCKTDENWAKNSGIDFNNKSEVVAWFKTEFAEWNTIWTELFENAEVHFSVRPQYCMPLDQSWKALPNLTMIGDAAHLMPPYAGEGVNMAMQDAFELSTCLTSTEFGDTQTAIAAFEKQMCARASNAAQMTLDSTEMMHSGDPIKNLIQLFTDFTTQNN
jgi:2-polyprenyl-6-methoxyphenol hydroxylase-like FAD-dependent oxidoreductase